jgi:hypothetical protein
MKILLQDCSSKKYMRLDSAWVDDINEAMDFLSVIRAVSFGVRELKSAFNIVQIEAGGWSDVIVFSPARTSGNITTIATENLNLPEAAGVTRYAISAAICENSD